MHAGRTFGLKRKRLLQHVEWILYLAVDLSTSKREPISLSLRFHSLVASSF